jgi:ferredoxin
MRLVINHNKCRRSGQCSYLHPELFKSGNDGVPTVLVEYPGEELREAAEEMVELCPNGAIFLVAEEGSSRG